MSVSEKQRFELYESMREVLGDHATTLMELLPRDATELATRQDLDYLEARLRAEMVELRETLRGEFHTALTAQTRTLLIGLLVVIVASNLTQLLA